MRNEIVTAVRAFGETSHNIRIRSGNGTAEVFVNGEYFGIWDCNRKTFVD